MTREECVKDLQRSAEGIGFITRKELLKYLGIKKWDHAKRFVEGCTQIDGKYFFIREVAGVIMSRSEREGQAQ